MNVIISKIDWSFKKLLFLLYFKVKLHFLDHYRLRRCIVELICVYIRPSCLSDYLTHSSTSFHFTHDLTVTIRLVTVRQWHIHSNNNNSSSDLETYFSLSLARSLPLAYCCFFYICRKYKAKGSICIGKCPRVLEWIVYYWKDKIILQITRHSHRSLQIDIDAIGRKSSVIDKSRFRLHNLRIISNKNQQW